MKSKNILITSLTILYSFLFLVSCNKWMVPPELVGQWDSGRHKVVVRTSPKWMTFEFTPGLASFSVNIKADKTVSGNIGNALFSEGKLEKNGGNPKKTGVAYRVECGKIGTIFPGDPVNEKEVELWLSPIKDGMHAELRYTEHGAMFPMADIEFKKKKD